MTIYVLLNGQSATVLLLGSVGGFYSKWQGNFSIDWNCYYKIIRQVLNVSLKASLKSVIAEMDSFGAVKKRGSCHSLLLVSQGIWASHRDTYWGNLIGTHPDWPLRQEQARLGAKIWACVSPASLQFSPNTESDNRRWMEDRKYQIYLFIPQAAMSSLKGYFSQCWY